MDDRITFVLLPGALDSDTLLYQCQACKDKMKGESETGGDALEDHARLVHHTTVKVIDASPAMRAHKK